jgi:hypothetical protein
MRTAALRVRRLQCMPVAGAVDGMDSFTDGLFVVRPGLSAGRPRFFDVLYASELGAPQVGAAGKPSPGEGVGT